MGMFTKIEEEIRKELIDVYGQYLSRPFSEQVKHNAENLAQKHLPSHSLVSKEVATASAKLYLLAENKLSKREAKRIFHSLMTSQLES